MNGWICLNKPEGITSNFALISASKKIKELTGKKEKMGFVGTLDPFASGVLPLAIGEATKFIPYLKSQKEYSFSVRFGAETDTLDKTGNFLNYSSNIPSKDEILSVLPTFLGEISQTPPKFSAIKINGQRACDLMRRGKDVTLKSRKIHIFSLDLVDFSDKTASFKATVSQGTYIRALALDIAKKLNALCYVETLTRQKSGFFSINHSKSLENLKKISHTKELLCEMLTLDSPLDDIPVYYLSCERVVKLRNGLSTRLGPTDYKSGDLLKIYSEGSCEFIGLGSVSEGLELIPLKLCSY